MHVHPSIPSATFMIGGRCQPRPWGRYSSGRYHESSSAPCSTYRSSGILSIDKRSLFLRCLYIPESQCTDSKTVMILGRRNVLVKMRLPSCRKFSIARADLLCGLGADMLTDVFPLPWCGFRIICTLSPNWEFNVHCEFPFAWMRNRRMLFLSACK